MSQWSPAVIRRTLRYFMPWAAAVLLLAAWFHRVEFQQEVRRVEIQDRALVQAGKATLGFALQQASSDLRALAGFADLIDVLDRSDLHSHDDLTREYLNFARERRRYDRIRWIDERGQERLVVDFDARGTRALPAEQLQQAGGDPDFVATMALRKGEVHVSRLELKRSNGRIEDPRKPLLRISTPLANSQGERRGVLAVDFLAEDMLARFSQAMAAASQRVMLLDSDAHWLVSPHKEDEWAFMAGPGDSLARRNPEAWATLRDSDSGHFADAGGQWTFATVYPALELGADDRAGAAGSGIAAQRHRWKVVLGLPASAIAELRLAALPPTLGVSALALLIMLFGSWRLAAARAHQHLAEAALRQSNLELEQVVEERTRQLHVEVFDRQMAERRYRESAEQYQQMLATMRDAYWLSDVTGRLLDINDAACRLLGYSRDELLNLAITDIDCLESPAAVAAHMRQVQVRGHDRFESVHRCRDGQTVEVEVSVSYLAEYQRFVSLIRDITDRKKLEAERRLAALVLENTDEGVVICNAALEILSVNRACEHITGYAARELVGRSPLQVAAADRNIVVDVFVAELMDHLQRDGSWRGELSARRKAGDIYPVWLNVSVVRDAEHGIAYYVGVFSDITPIKESQERIAFLAHHDALTGLPNRLLFNARLEHGIERARRDTRSMAVLFLDLDRFKEVNDSCGHATGDQLLKDLAVAMGHGLRGEDTLARLGGDEFVILLEEVDGRSGVGSVLAKIEQVFPWPVPAGERVIEVTASIGIAVFPDDGADAASLIHRADLAMYAAKAAGRAGHCYAGDLEASAQPTRSAASATSQ